MSTTPTTRGSESGEIQSDIRQTRQEMDSTIDALGERLKPRHLLDDFLEMFRTSDDPNSSVGRDVSRTARKMGKNLVHQIGEHPMPALLIGAGFAWLLMDDKDDDDADYRPSRRRRQAWSDPVAEAPFVSYEDDWSEGGSLSDYDDDSGSGLAARAKGALGQAKDKLSSAADSVRDTVSGAASSVRESVSGAASTVRHTASRTADRTSAAGSRIRHGATAAGRQAQHGYEAGRETLAEAMEEYPLAVGAAALGFGLLVGFALPRTRREDQLMGETSDEMLERAKGVGEQLLDQGRQAAESAVSAGTEEARRQGLSADTLGEKVQQVGQKIQQVASRVMETAKQEGKSLVGEQAGGAQNQGQPAAGSQAGTGGQQQATGGGI